MPTTKPRKPKRPDDFVVNESRAWDRAGLTVVGTANARIRSYGTLVLTTPEARRLHDWLGRYIAWREAKDAD